ncbi:hypothetical protein [Diplocloster hominis]|uniref:hypothetical protein n=1 Tax=Diplocloster hominis TaxID=3079010 RepID=UPI0031BA4FF2
MLFEVPEKIRDKFHYSGSGGYLDDPYTPDEKRICDEFVKKMKEAKNQEIVFEE